MLCRYHLPCLWEILLLPEVWHGLKYMTAQWLINYHMAKRQREAYHVFICYKGGLVFVCMSPCLCYGEGEVSQREVTWWNSGWGWIDYRLEWSFHVSAEVILLQGFIFMLTLRSQCSTAVLRAAKTWNKPIPAFWNAEHKKWNDWDTERSRTWSTSTLLK